MTREEAEAIVEYVQAAIEARHTLEGPEADREQETLEALLALVDPLPETK